MRSWVEGANAPGCDFPLENLPYGVFRQAGDTRIGIAIGYHILDLRGCAKSGLLGNIGEETRAACSRDILNHLMSLGPMAWSSLRRNISSLLDTDGADSKLQAQVRPHLIAMTDVEMQLPAQIGDYTDFYASIHHATRVGKLFRPDQPLLPNYKYVPIGYHGRASSIVVSGTQIVRPSGQTKAADSPDPVFGPSRSLDYELEMGFFVGPGNLRGEAIPITGAEEHIFGLCLVNDWSARDIQSWEYQPLGPFLAKSFATSISPWVVTMEALAPYRIAAEQRTTGDPEPLLYLSGEHSASSAFDVTVEAFLQTEQMRRRGLEAIQLSKGNLRNLYWSLAQLVTHHASNGCNLRPGDLLATGTISGPEEGSEGCMLEMKHRSTSVALPTGETRMFLEDGDQIILRAFCERSGLPRIGFGECTGTIVAS